eukprot:scaffold92916_cov72-Phaeocystis_antarctica.AAC.1
MVRHDFNLGGWYSPRNFTIVHRCWLLPPRATRSREQRLAALDLVCTFLVNLALLLDTDG